MRPAFYLWILAATAIVLATGWRGLQANLPEAPASPQLSLTAPSTIRQGEAMLVRLRVDHAEHVTDRSTLPKQLSFGGKAFPLFWDVADYQAQCGQINPQVCELGQYHLDYTALVGVRIDLPPGGYTLSVPGFSALSQALQIKPGGYSRQNIAVSKSMGGLQPEVGELEAIQAFKLALNPERLWHLPLKPPTPDCMNSPFGNLRFYNGKFTGNYHKGIDTRSPQGRPVKAATEGIVTIARVYRLHGGTVGVEHGQGLKTIHIHLSKILVTPGQRVTQGQTLGLVGATGFATGPHLHWGVFAGGEAVNPVWITQGIRACGQ